MNRKLYLAALGLALATAAAGTMPVMAEGKDAYTAVAGGKATFEKYLIMKDNAEVPNVTFSFTAAPAENVINADKDAGTLKVYKGVGNPTIADVTFAQGQETWTKAQGAQDLPTTVNVQKEDTKDTTNKDKLTLGDGEKYARKDVTVDLSGISFNEPGVYRYVITEVANADNAANGISNDADETRILDVYVVDDADHVGTLKVEGYVLQNGDATGAVKKDGTGAVEKSKGFANKYTTNDLTISKKVEGNQASRDEYFKMTVTLSGIANNVYDIDYTNADATTKINAINTAEIKQPATIKVGANGSVTQDFWLQNGQSIVIKGVTANASYTVAEDKAVVDAEAYTPTAAVTGDDAKKDGTKIAMDGNYAVTDDALTADATVAFTNTKNGTIPTGIIMSVAPYAAIVLLGGAGATIVMRKKKEEDAE